MLKVTDLFCGMGGLSFGFSRAGFHVKGYDINKHTPEIFTLNKIGTGEILDLSTVGEKIDSDVIIGGPPCKPWSSVNVTRRKNEHPDHKLVEAFFKLVLNSEPDMFLMENVPPVKNDDSYKNSLDEIRKKYSVDNLIVKYSNYGAATNRRRLITYGFKNHDAKQFISILETLKKPASSVREAIQNYEKYGWGEFPDHQWPNLKTIQKYDSFYKTGKYGWYKLKWDEPAPSFGNVMKTYTLHPRAGDNFPVRVISVREVMAIMGFPDDYIFPQKMGHTTKYQMIADVVSPIFSQLCAQAIREIMT